MRKYENRPSPAWSAKDAPDWIAVGNQVDDWLYKSVANKNDVYSWKKFKKIARQEQHQVGWDDILKIKKIQHIVVTTDGDRYGYNYEGNLQKVD